MMHTMKHNLLNSIDCSDSLNVLLVCACRIRGDSQKRATTENATNLFAKMLENQKPKKYATWARFQTVFAQVLLLTGSIILFFYPDSKLQFISKFVLLGTSILFLGLEVFNKTLPILYQYNILKGVLLLGQGGLGILFAPTHPGSLCTICAGLTYTLSSLSGE